MNTLDFIVLILLALGGFTGFRKGLITGLSRFAGKIAAIAIAVLFYKQFLDTLDQSIGLREKIEPQVAAFLIKIMENTSVSGPGSTEVLAQSVLGQATMVVTDYILMIGALLLLFFVVSVIINLLIAVIITPLAKNFSIINRGGGLAFGFLSMLVAICLFAGLSAPLLTTAASGAAGVGQSFMYPWLLQGYEIIQGAISVFAGDILTNPLEGFPITKEMAI